MRRFMAIVLLAALFPIVSPASAGDLVWERFMRNNHGVIAIGEISELTDEVCVITVESTVVSARGNREQLKPDVIRLRLDEDEFTQYIGNRDACRQVGDYVLVAADKAKKGRLFDGYMYKVDSLDKETLSLTIARNSSSAFRMEVAMIEDFIHSDGQNTEYGTRTTKDGKRRQVLRFRDQDRRYADAKVIFEVDVSLP